MSSAQKLHVASGYHMGLCKYVTCRSQNPWAMGSKNFMSVCGGGRRWVVGGVRAAISLGWLEGSGAAASIGTAHTWVMRWGSGKNRKGPCQCTNLPLPFLLSPFPCCLSAELWCSWAVVSDCSEQGLFYLSPLDATCGLYATLTGLSFQLWPQGVAPFYLFLLQSLPFFMCKGLSFKACLSHNLLPLPLNFSFFLLIF